jgi:hypothetical protein
MTLPDSQKWTPTGKNTDSGLFFASKGLPGK